MCGGLRVGFAVVVVSGFAVLGLLLCGFRGVADLGFIVGDWCFGGWFGCGLGDCLIYGFTIGVV